MSFDLGVLVLGVKYLRYCLNSIYRIYIYICCCITFPMALLIMYRVLKILFQLVSDMAIVYMYSLIIDVSRSASFLRNVHCVT